MEYENFEKVEELVKEIKDKDKTLDILSGSPTVTITEQYGVREIILDLSKTHPTDFKGYAEDLIQSMKGNLIAKILEIKEELRKL